MPIFLFYRGYLTSEENEDMSEIVIQRARPQRREKGIHRNDHKMRFGVCGVLLISSMFSLFFCAIIYIYIHLSNIVKK